jgi:hypothetical protein
MRLCSPLSRRFLPKRRASRAISGTWAQRVSRRLNSDRISRGRQAPARQPASGNFDSEKVFVRSWETEDFFDFQRKGSPTFRARADHQPLADKVISFPPGQVVSSVLSLYYNRMLVFGNIGKKEERRDIRSSLSPRREMVIFGHARGGGHPGRGNCWPSSPVNYLSRLKIPWISAYAGMTCLSLISTH